MSPAHHALLSLLRPPDRKTRWISLGAAVGAHLAFGLIAFLLVVIPEQPPMGPKLLPLVAEQTPIFPPPRPIARVIHQSEPERLIAIPDPDPDRAEPMMIDDEPFTITPVASPDGVADWSGPASEPPQDGPMEITHEMVSPRIISGTRIQPEYPEHARRAGVEGDVLLRAVIRRDGTVGSLEVVQAPRADLGLSEAALTAVSQWRYHPARLEGRPVEVYFMIEVTFRLDQ